MPKPTKNPIKNYPTTSLFLLAFVFFVIARALKP